MEVPIRFRNHEPEVPGQVKDGHRTNVRKRAKFLHTFGARIGQDGRCASSVDGLTDVEDGVDLGWMIKGS
ncbi:MAG: hypothetical protein MJD61_19215 [Proteobacteria bacterium]|nr:hypothetical protein [Pseudomonadota bacterium]